MASEDVVAMASEDVVLRLLDDDALVTVCKWLGVTDAEKTRRTCARFLEVTSRDSVWKPLCQRRWAKRRQTSDWTAAATQAAAAAPRNAGSWRASYVQNEGVIHKKGLPVFAMNARLQIGGRYDLHFFEPRYRWLVHRAVHDHNSHFVFCVQWPESRSDKA